MTPDEAIGYLWDDHKLPGSASHAIAGVIKRLVAENEEAREQKELAEECNAHEVLKNEALRREVERLELGWNMEIEARKMACERVDKAHRAGMKEAAKIAKRWITIYLGTPTCPTDPGAGIAEAILAKAEKEQGDEV